MNARTFLTTLAVGCSLAVTARADFFDNFDSYADQAAFATAWTINSGTLSLQTTTAHSAPNAVGWVSSAAARAYRAVGGAGVAASAIDWSFWYYDNGATRDFNCIYGYTGAWGSTLNTVLALGDYNSVSGKYEGRYSAITGAQYADGAASDGGTGGWFSLNASRANGWHFMEVIGSADPVNSGKAKLQFYIDNSLVGSVANLADYNLTYACIGGAVSVGTTGGATDDYSVMTIVPEPSSIALALVGGLALAWGGIFRRRG